MAMVDHRRLSNEELIDLLFNQEDRLPRAAVDEILRRESEMLPILSEIAMDRTVWIADTPEWWAPVHATYILGAIGGPEVLVPLLAALRWSDAYDNEWAAEDLPSILGSMGEISRPAILGCIADRSAGWSARSIAMDALGSQAMRTPDTEEESMGLLGAILRDESEEYGARRSAAYILLDFRRTDFKKELIAIAWEEDRRQQQLPDYRVAFTPDQIESELTLPRRGMDVYLRDWLTFYDADEITRRQSRWTEQDSRRRMEVDEELAPHSRQSFVISPSDPCPCGSGKPYRRCCFKKLH